MSAKVERIQRDGLFDFMNDKSVIPGMLMILLLPAIVLGALYYSKPHDNNSLENSSTLSDFASQGESQFAVIEQTERSPTSSSCDSWMVNSSTGGCLNIDDWCKEKVGNHGIGKETLDIDPIIRENSRSSCLCEEGFHFSNRGKCIKNCGVGECVDDDKCTELPKNAFCNTDLSGNETGDGWHCIDGFVKIENTCVNKVEVQLYCMNKYGANSKIDDTGNCVCMYGYHLGVEFGKSDQCVID